MDWFYNSYFIGALIAPLIMLIVGNCIYHPPSWECSSDPEPNNKKRYHRPRRKYRLKLKRRLLKKTNRLANANTSNLS